ncbi:MAG: hypothetical protein AAGF90_13720 [Pseudomonadota bacterium]
MNSAIAGERSLSSTRSTEIEAAQIDGATIATANNDVLTDLLITKPFKVGRTRFSEATPAIKTLV